MGSVIASDEGQKFVDAGISPFLWKKWPIRKRLDSYMKNIVVVPKTNDWSIRKDGTPVGSSNDAGQFGYTQR